MPLGKAKELVMVGCECKADQELSGRKMGSGEGKGQGWGDGLG